MEQRNDGLLATSAKAPRLRKRLQKCVTKQQPNMACRSATSVSNSIAPYKGRDIADNRAPPPRPPPPPREGRLATSPTREGHIYEQKPPPESLECLKPHTYIAPEFAHLINTKPQRTPSGSDSTNSPMPKMRRRAKTPVLSIGQLEDLPRPHYPLGRTSSVDLIAEQYRAILESQRCSVYSDDFSEPELSPHSSDADEPVTLRRRRSSGYLQNEPPLGDFPRMGMGEAPGPSPISDDGTLVSYQGETVYFKPVSFSPEPPESPLRPLSRQSTTAAEEHDNVSLQVCLDLLTRELSSAMAGRPYGRSSSTSSGTSALQILVMIEAYERLRDQMAELSRGNEQARAMEGMFDMWLRALYKMHDSMTEGAEVGKGSNGYGRELQTKELS